MMGAPRFLKKSALLVLAMLLALLLAGQGQASAQGGASASPGASQYGGETSAPAMDVADIPPTVSDNVDDGTGSVNEAMTDRGASPAEASPTAGASSSAKPGGEGITALPETGGASSPAPVVALCAGVLLLVCSLLLLRSSLHRG